MFSRVLAAGAVAAGCGGELPPFEDLPLRDGLMADSRAVAALPAAARARLAERFEAERTAPEAALEAPEGRPPDAVTRAVDETRQRGGQDALVAYTVRGARAVTFAAVIPEGARPTRSITVEGSAPAETEALEARALGERAGAIVEALQRVSGAPRVARVDGWPVGAAVVGDVVYVNGAWLTALAPESTTNAGPLPPVPPAPPAPSAFTNQGGADAGTIVRDASTDPSAGTRRECSDAPDPCWRRCDYDCDCDDSACARSGCGCGGGSCSPGSTSRSSCDVAPSTASHLAWGASRLAALLAPLAFVLARSRRGG